MKPPEGQWILVVDDDPVFSGLLSDLLTLGGYSTLEASTYAEANEALTYGEPALAIVDYKLPDLDGVTFITNVRNAGKNFPIIFLSAVWCDIGLFNRLRNVLKVSLILQKPIEPKLFMAQIHDVLPRAADAGKMLATVGDDYRRGSADSSVYNLPLKHSDAVAQALAKAKQAFAVELPERVSKLSELVQNAKLNNCPPHMVKDAADEAHKLKGSSSSFGYKGLSTMAAKVEHLLANLETDGGSMSELMWSEINRYLSDSGAFAAAAAEAGGAPVALTASGGKRILLFAADEALCREMSGAISGELIEVIGACDLKSALAQAEDHRVQAVAIDVSGCDLAHAKELVAKLRKRTGYELLPVIAFTEPDCSVSAAQLLELGASTVLKRPFSLKEFELAMRAALDRYDPEKVRILTLDDDSSITNFIESILTPEGISVRAHHEPINVLDVLESFKPDAMLVDVVMPGVSGYDVCRMVRDQEQWADLPILFLTSKIDPEGRSFAFQAGASDFLAKPIIAQELLVRVKSHVENSPRTKSKRDRDPVTGLIQRAALEKQLSDMLDAAQKSRQPLVLAILEIDNFDKVHGKFGIPGTRDAFALVGSSLIPRFRAEDIKAQLGNIFMLAFYGKTTAEVEPALGSVCDEIRQIKLSPRGEDSFSISVTFGLSQLFADTSQGHELLGIALENLRSAQQALTKPHR